MSDRNRRFRFETGLFWVLLVTVLVCGCQNPTSQNLPPPTVHQVSKPYQGKVYAFRTNTLVPENNETAPPGWVPLGGGEDRSRWEGILIHHSAMDEGNAAMIGRSHQQQGFDEMGYHFLIDNGRGGPNGKIEVGSRWPKQKYGAHCRVNLNDDNYWNEHTIGICLVGNFENYPPTEAQYQSLADLVHFLQKRYHIPDNRIKGHRDVDQTKCPGRLFSFSKLRYLLSQQ